MLQGSLGASSIEASSTAGNEILIPTSSLLPHSRNDIPHGGLQHGTPEMEPVTTLEYSMTSCTGPFSPLTIFPSVPYHLKVLAPQSSHLSLSNNDSMRLNTPTSSVSPPSSNSAPTKRQVEERSQRSCDICGRPFGIGTKLAFDRHVNSHKRLECKYPECEETFRNERGRNRHYQTKKHQAKIASGNPRNAYQCRCGAQSSSRKDNHLRHVASCKKNPTTLYRCPCGTSITEDKEVHAKHLKRCKPTI